MDEATKKIDKGEPVVALTRREWLVSLGSAVVLSGFRGAPGQAQQDAHEVGAALPPGLYRPSFDHLAHALASEDPFLPIPRGTETEYLRPRSGPFIPQAFAQEEFPVVRQLVEIILGEDLKNSSEKPAYGAPASHEVVGRHSGAAAFRGFRPSNGALGKNALGQVTLIGEKEPPGLESDSVPSLKCSGY
jgi:hypothetical protein